MKEFPGKAAAITGAGSGMGHSAAAEHGARSTDLDVLIVGAGLSGIGAAYHLKKRCPYASVAILEARDAIGGTWDLFRYPGIRSDSDMFTLGYSFRPWHSEKAISDGQTILDYIQDTARTFGIDKTIRFGHKVVSADWDSHRARWTVGVERTNGDAHVAHGLATRDLTRRDYAPLPVLGVPGWWAANAAPAFYDDPAVFRSGRRTRRL